MLVQRCISNSLHCTEFKLRVKSIFIEIEINIFACCSFVFCGEVYVSEMHHGLQSDLFIFIICFSPWGSFWPIGKCVLQIYLSFGSTWTCWMKQIPARKTMWFIVQTRKLVKLEGGSGGSGVGRQFVLINSGSNFCLWRLRSKLLFLHFPPVS